MKSLVLLIAVVVVAGSLSGCAGSLIRSGYNMVATPELSVCDVEGKSIEDAEKLLGKPDAIKRNPGGEQVRTYTKGALVSVITFKDGKVISADCNNGGDK